MGVTNHHGTGEVLVEVVHILAHSGAEGGKDVSNAQSGCGGVRKGWRSYRLLRLAEIQM